METITAKYHKDYCVKVRQKYHHLRLFDTGFVLGKHCKLLIVLCIHSMVASHNPFVAQIQLT